MRAHRVILLLCLLWPAPVRAQPAPTIVSTLQTTNTGATSLQVGCAVGSSTCTGGIVAGTVLANALGAEAGYVEIQSNVPASTTYRLYNNSGTLMWNGITLATGSSVSGTTGTIALFTASNAIGNSIMTQSGTTITVANTLSATTLAGTLSTANQPNVTGLGTITSGVWSASATKIGLGSGGTAADLSGTGGTSQFLRQNAIGAAVSVVRPAVADLSDASNVALLNAANTFSVTQNSPFVQIIRNTNNGSSATADLRVANDVDAGLGRLVAYSSTTAVSAFAGPSITALSASGGLNLGSSGASQVNVFTNNTARWGINSAGDFTVGSSNHLAFSAGTPSAGTGTAGTLGLDFSIVVGGSGSAHSTAAVTFGHTLSAAPACTATFQQDPVGITITYVSTTTTAATIHYSSNISSESVALHCFNSQ